MRKRTMLIMATLMLVGLMSTLSIVATPVQAQSTTVYLDPSEIEYNLDEVSVGYRFNVTAWVGNVTDLSSFQVVLFYNASVINCTGAIALFVPMPGMPLGPAYTYFDSWGAAMVGTTGMAGSTPFNGTRDLAVFEFEIIAEPPEGGTLTSDLVISYIPSGGPPWETKLKDSEGEYISFVGTDGGYTIIPEFLSFLMLPIFSILTLVALVLAKRLQRKRQFGYNG